MITISTCLEQKLHTYPLVLQLQSADDDTFLSNQSQKSTQYPHQPHGDRPKRISFRQIKIHKLPIYISMVVVLLIILHFSRKIKTDLNRQSSISKTFQPLQSQSSGNQSINSNIFQIEYNFWIFEDEKYNQTYLQQLTLQNHHRYAENSNFTVYTINEQNFHHYVSKRRAKELASLINQLKNRVGNSNQKSNLKQHLPKIIKTVILLNILAENGGIMVTETFIFTQDFSWIQQINDNIYVNRGNGAVPEVVGFYTPAFSFPQTKQNKKHNADMEEVDKYMTIFPTVESYFLAAKKQSSFIIAMMNEITEILLDPWQIQNEIAHNLYHLNNFQGKDIYYEYFKLAVQKVLQDKQKELDQDNYQYRHRRFAIDSYGLFLINCFYGPYKLKHFWNNKNPQKIIQNLAQYDLKELEASVGPLRYISFLSREKQLNIFLNDAVNKKNRGILSGSFLQKMLYPNMQQIAIHINKEKSMVNQSAEPWHSLPRIIWIYWDKGLKNSNISNQLFVQNLKKMAKYSNFEFKQVNDTNIGDYLQESVLERINKALKQAKVRIYRPTKSDLYRLALIAAHGGLYFDSSYIALQNLDWLINIGKYPSQYIFNRYGNLPKVFMVFHPHFGGPFQWTINQQYNTKANWHLAYENNLIIAQKGAELIQQWFDLFLQLLQTPYQQISQIFSSYELSYHKWTNKRNQYLLAMDSIKCVIGRRQKQLKDAKQVRYADASDYYKIWSMSGYLGQQKLRFNTNYANYDERGNNNNVFLTRYSQEYVEGLLGKINHFTKFYHYHNMEISKFVIQNANNFSQQAHSQSIFMKYIFDETKVILQDNATPKTKF